MPTEKDYRKFRVQLAITNWNPADYPLCRNKCSEYE